MLRSRRRGPGLASESGFSLLELIIVIVIIGILAGVGARVFYYEVNMYDTVVSNTEALQRLRGALQMMSRDMRQIASADSLYQASTDSIRFTHVDGQSISYQFSGSQIYRNSDLLLEHVTLAELAYFDDSGNLISTPVNNFSQINAITINLTTAFDNKSFDLSTRVRPRNF